MGGSTPFCADCHPVWFRMVAALKEDHKAEIQRLTDEFTDTKGRLERAREAINEWSGSLLELLGDQVASAFRESFDTALTGDTGRLIARVEGYAWNNLVQCKYPQPWQIVGTITCTKFAEMIPVTVKVYADDIHEREV